MPMECGNKLTSLMVNKLTELALAVRPAPGFTAPRPAPFPRRGDLWHPFARLPDTNGFTVVKWR